MEQTEQQKPVAKLIGADGNIFNLLGIASKALKRAGMHDKAKEMFDKVTNEAKNYNEAILIIMEFVEVE